MPEVPLITTACRAGGDPPIVYVKVSGASGTFKVGGFTVRLTGTEARRLGPFLKLTAPLYVVGAPVSPVGLTVIVRLGLRVLPGTVGLTVSQGPPEAATTV